MRAATREGTISVMASLLVISIGFVVSKLACIAGRRRRSIAC